MSFDTYYRAVRYLEKLGASPHDQAYMRSHNSDPEQFLERTRELVSRLGDPGKYFRYVHVSGTSGKGTTVTSLHNMLCSDGRRVGSFTSPYATTSIEKIKVNDKLINPATFARLVKKIRPVIEGMEKNGAYGRPTYFEIFFAIALLYFKEQKCDWVILEVGCGGTYDAGNIIKTSISATTNVGLDHTKLLGNTLSKIAREKAGIIKPHSHFFTTERRERIRAIFKQKCAKEHATMHIVSGKKFQESDHELARAIARHIGVSEQAIARGDVETILPCRFEIMDKKPTIVLDGAHNPDKIRSVVHNSKQLTYDTLYTIFASAKNKNAKAMLALLAPITKHFIFTEFSVEGRDSYTAAELTQRCPRNIPHSSEPDPIQALIWAKKRARSNDCILVTGSFFLTGALRKQWIPEATILKNRSIVHKPLINHSSR